MLVVPGILMGGCRSAVGFFPLHASNYESVKWPGAGAECGDFLLSCAPAGYVCCIVREGACPASRLLPFKDSTFASQWWQGPGPVFGTVSLTLIHY